MNRARRRAEKWAKLNMDSGYDAFVSRHSPAAVQVMMWTLRELVGPDAPVSDADLWEGIRELIDSRFLNVWVRLDGDRYQVEPELLFPDRGDAAPPLARLQ